MKNSGPGKLWNATLPAEYKRATVIEQILLGFIHRQWTVLIRFEAIPTAYLKRPTQRDSGLIARRRHAPHNDVWMRLSRSRVGHDESIRKQKNCTRSDERLKRDPLRVNRSDPELSPTVGSSFVQRVLFEQSSRP